MKMKIVSLAILCDISTEKKEDIHPQMKECIELTNAAMGYNCISESCVSMIHNSSKHRALLAYTLDKQLLEREVELMVVLGENLVPNGIHLDTYSHKKGIEIAIPTPHTEFTVHIYARVKPERREKYFADVKESELIKALTQTATKLVALIKENAAVTAAAAGGKRTS